MIEFNRAYRSRAAADFLSDEFVSNGSFVGGGPFTKLCEDFFGKFINLPNAIFTTSCTDALEMSAELCNLQAGDHIIVPAYTFVSSVLPFSRYTNNISFVDCELGSCNTPAEYYESKITSATKVIVSVNYGGLNPYQPQIRQLCDKHGIILVEDAAQSLGASLNKKNMGSYGDFSAFSFHDTKNVNAGGEGGCLVVNNTAYLDRAHVLSEKGTNRRQFINNSVSKYEWLDYGSSHVMSDLNAAILYKNLLSLDDVTSKRAALANIYGIEFKNQSLPFGPSLPEGAQSNGHLFYLLLSSPEERVDLIGFLLEHGVESASHYLDLSKSPFSRKNLNNNDDCPNASFAENVLLRLPLHFNMSENQIYLIANLVAKWRKK